tara:strand:+ start:90 stop:305 length:216 start_codon:yes stop_codon:yes gene_type:complete
MVIFFLQVLPLIISLFSPEFKMILMSDGFDGDISHDTVVMFEQFALVLGLTVIGIITFIYGVLSFNDLDLL